jgi:xylan 1,4-beta-xylosidase
MEYDPVSFQNMAGLICYYDTKNFYYLHMTHDEENGNYLNVMTCQNGMFEYPLKNNLPLKGVKRCFLQAKVAYDILIFAYSIDGINWQVIDQVFDASTLSDEFDAGGTHAHFTGAFVGICCQDTSGEKRHADFDFFEYVEG